MLRPLNNFFQSYLLAPFLFSLGETRAGRFFEFRWWTSHYVHKFTHAHTYVYKFTHAHIRTYRHTDIQIRLDSMHACIHEYHTGVHTTHTYTLACMNLYVQTKNTSALRHIPDARVTTRRFSGRKSAMDKMYNRVTG